MFKFLQSVVLCLIFTLNSFAQNEGFATEYAKLGTPYGGCGVPKELLETQYFVALNTFNSPGNYGSFTVPLAGSDLQYMGEFSNGSNCGRWLKVTIGANCQGTNDGAQNQAFCRGAGAKWVDDKYSGATLYMLVADACPDANAWCRDSPFHLDLFEPALNNFEKNGVAVTDMYPASFNNRKIIWEYTPSPNYSGDIKIYFTVNAQIYYPAIMVNNLPNGIHAIEQKVGNNWVKATINKDLGQQFTLNSTVTTYRIRMYDADDQLLNNGREYIFTFPKACGSLCTAAATPVTYQTFDPTVTGIDESAEQVQNPFYAMVEDGLLILHKRDNASLSGAQFSLLDLNGKEVVSSQVDFAPNQQAYMISQINKGIYVLVVKTCNGQKVTQKIVY